MGLRGLEPTQIRDVPKAREGLINDRGAVRFSRAARNKRRAATIDSSPAGRAMLERIHSRKAAETDEVADKSAST